MAQVIYAAFGPRPANPVNQTARCNVCEPTFGLLGSDLYYDTEADARTTAQNGVLRAAILNAVAPQLWTALWNNFRCTNAACGNRQACNQRPTHLAIGARTMPMPPPAGVLKWQIVVGLAREIRCIGGAAVPDEVPEIPWIDVLDPPVFLAALDDVPLPVGGDFVSLPPEPDCPPLKGGKKAGKKAAKSKSSKKRR